MFIVKIQGGLGNQMFQYLFGQYLKNKYTQDIMYDISSFEKLNGTNLSGVDEFEFELNKFNINIPIINTSNIKYSKDNFLKRIFFTIQNFNNTKTQILIREKKFKIFSHKLNKVKNYYFSGYWQNAQYYTNMENIAYNSFILKDEFPIKNKKILNMIQNSNAISLHIRRGDYARLGLGTCNMHYYQQAIKILKSKLDYFELFIFSDDLDWVKDNMRFDVPLTYVHSDNSFPFEDIYLMSQCKHNIIANSTFSWWGAYLNQTQKKIVIAPNVWNVKNNVLSDNIVPDGWLKI